MPKILGSTCFEYEKNSNIRSFEQNPSGMNVLKLVSKENIEFDRIFFITQKSNLNRIVLLFKLAGKAPKENYAAANFPKE